MYIALDGGGTKTEILLLDEDFRAADSLSCGCANHEQLTGGYDGAGRVLREALEELLDRNGLAPGQIRDLAAGIAGVDTAADEEAYALRLKQAGFARLEICNDGYLPVWANAPQGWGVAYNCGTGVCCNAVGPGGERSKTGGLDEWAGDAGGGRWITQQVFRAVYDSRVLKLAPTLLEELYVAAFGAGDEEELIESLMRMKREQQRQRAVIRMLFQAAEAGDAAALAVEEQMLARASAYVRAAVRRTEMGEGEIPVILTGSVLLQAAAPSYLRKLEARICGTVRRARVSRAENSPVLGAVRRLRERNR